MLLPIMFAGFLGQTTFTVRNSGAVSMVTDGNGPFTSGVAQPQPTSGDSVPAAFTLLDERIGGVLTSETSIPDSQAPPFASPPLGGRIYVEVRSTITTGIAVVASLTTATINFHLSVANYSIALNCRGFEV